ncbi:MAG: hypothetical protein IKY78_09410 [Clostridia bacterium]|nr:hypothetical protein [Clostridia bacterium]
MKKILSVILAVMMLFGTMSIGASAKEHETFVVPNSFNATTDVILVLRFGSGTCKDYITVYNQDIADYEQVTGVGGELVIVGKEVAANRQYVLPYVTPAEGNNFNGWYCLADGKAYPAGPTGGFTIPNTPGKVIILEAQYYPSAAEGDTMGTILGILTKVFGAIIGILFYSGDTEAGVAFMDKVLGGLDL